MTEHVTAPRYYVDLIHAALDRAQTVVDLHEQGHPALIEHAVANLREALRTIDEHVEQTNDELRPRPARSLETARRRGPG